MALPITYADPLHADELMQGDILVRTPELDKILSEVHPYFKDPKYLYFMVLTQTCDLVVREGGLCKAPYISIAPVRSIDTIVERKVKEHKLPIDADVPVITDKSRAQIDMFLGRLFKNNEPGYFFLDATETAVLGEDCCAFLDLAISLKAGMHFNACLAAKRLELKEVWQAKLGWLIAQMFSRVGTEDLPPAKVQEKVNNALRDATVSVPAAKVAAVEQEFQRLRGERGGDLRLKPKEVIQIANKVASKKQEVIEQTISVVGKALPPESANLLPTLKKRLQDDAGLTALLRGS